MPEFCLSMADSLLDDLDRQDGEAARWIAMQKERIGQRERRRWDFHVDRGEILVWAKTICDKRTWGKWLQERGWNRGHAHRLILVYRDPEGTWARSGGDLSRVAKEECCSPATKRVSHKAVVTILRRAIECLEQPVSACTVCEAIRELQDATHDRPYRDCAGCEVGIQGRREIEAELKRETLHDHPVWPWVKKLVIHSGKSGGECRLDEWVKKHLRTSYDELAEDLGYERGEVRAVGHRPRDYDLMPSEALKGDLTEAYRLARELKKGR